MNRAPLWSLLALLAGCNPSACGAFLSPPDAPAEERFASRTASAPPGPLLAGAARVELSFADDVWLGGFGFFRASEGQLDPITARALALRRGEVTALVIGCDVVGLHNYQVEALRDRLSDVATREAILISATHNHSGPDTLGMWGALPPLCSGLEDEVVDTVLTGIESAARQAVARLQPARVRWGAGEAPARGISKNLRDPQRIDRGLTAVAFETPAGAALATLVHFAAHPEALGSDNDFISADFVAGLCDVLERTEGGPGGVTVYVNGAIGGLITTDAPDTTPAEVALLGGTLAVVAMDALGKATAFPAEVGLHAVRRPVWLPIQNRRFHLGHQFGIFGPRVFEGGHTLSEVMALAVGPLVLLTAPGEIEPRLAEELNRTNPGAPALLVGLGGDELGYFLHEEEFDEDRFSYERTVSPGPLASQVLREATREVLAELGDLRAGDE